MNEIRQAFEDYAIPLHYNVYRRGESYVDDRTARDSKIWRAAYEAGEIAMKEKAANRAAEFYLAKGDALDIARAIRALAISGAEESKKVSGG